MLDPLVALPQMTLAFAGHPLLRITRVEIRLVEAGLDLAVAPDSPERWHLTTSHWLELTCEAIAATLPQALPLLGTTGACVLTMGNTTLTASRSRVLGWSLLAGNEGGRERLVLRLEDWILDSEGG